MFFVIYITNRTDKQESSVFRFFLMTAIFSSIGSHEWGKIPFVDKTLYSAWKLAILFSSFLDVIWSEIYGEFNSMAIIKNGCRNGGTGMPHFWKVQAERQVPTSFSYVLLAVYGLRALPFLEDLHCGRQNYTEKGQPTGAAAIKWAPVKELEPLPHLFIFLQLKKFGRKSDLVISLIANVGNGWINLIKKIEGTSWLVLSHFPWFLDNECASFALALHENPFPFVSKRIYEILLNSLKMILKWIFS